MNFEPATRLIAKAASPAMVSVIATVTMLTLSVYAISGEISGFSPVCSPRIAAPITAYVLA
ncbi:hypothetical protein [Croceicoccus mobilis]|uniref:Uncharacterized protein n=1 Tax=Croceicoccus mobilis TaxID=1703339 RepID=A0A916YZT0_9SPHN|nr:hypothetical protein [Croceicoccus mobilis]GGD69630.1 hypothetical protein GCM10010990_18930 [Croceicoccus mobilis]